MARDDHLLAIPDDPNQFRQPAFRFRGADFHA